ncbi:MAG: hypothetical protein ACN4G0_10400 [Polyangiales bacterium]
MARSAHLSCLLGLALLTSPGCDRDKRAQDMFVTTTPWPIYGGYGDELEFRAESPGSPVLLFRRKRSSGVYRYDPSANAIAPADSDEWKRATGKVMGVFSSQTGSIRTSENRVSLQGSTVEPHGRHFLGLAYSSEFERVAILSANGLYRAQTSGLMFGGRNRYVAGPHFHQIIDIDSKAPIGKPIRLPLSSKRDGSIKIGWSSDDQYVLYFAPETRKVAIVRTGLKPSPLHRDPQNRIAVFRPHAWTHPLDDTVLLRYDTDQRDRFLLKMEGESPVYRFDASSFELTQAEEQAWDQASGQVYDASTLHEQPTPSVNGERTQRSQALRKVRPGKLRRGGDTIATAGETVIALSVAPDLETAVVLSRTKPARVYQELFRLPEATRIGPAVELPWLGAAPFIAWTPDERFILYSDGAQRLGIVDVQHARTVHPAERPAASSETSVKPVDPDRVSFDPEASCDPANPVKTGCPDDQGRCFGCRDAGDGHYRISLEPALPLFEAVRRYKSDQALDYKDCGDLSLQGTGRVRVNDCFAKAFTACNPAELRASWTGDEAAQSPVVMLAEPRDGNCVLVYFFEHQNPETNTRGLLRNECRQLDPDMTLTNCRLVEVRSAPLRPDTRGAGGAGHTPATTISH